MTDKNPNRKRPFVKRGPRVLTEAQKVIREQKKAVRAEKARVRALNHYYDNRDKLLKTKRDQYDKDRGQKKRAYYLKNRDYIIARQFSYDKSQRRLSRNNTTDGQLQEDEDTDDEYDPLPNFSEFIR